MKPYGIPRDPELEYPDNGTLHLYALKSSVGSIKTKSGEYKSYFKSSAGKHRTRRIWKKRQRRIFKQKLRKKLYENFEG